ncbi:type III toxin-antitoxin system ToxN/AbiQ family toxin [Sporomusa ovata]|uniref:type III toxin-antitoxin system ToxN/AbiQ family toxin n=1 Tax=Sporomusa ovata TaxID=2378 RepID=UPI0030CCF284
MEGKMDIKYDNFGFYKINIDYVKYLHSKDSQVFYDNTPDYSRKPYLGLITQLGGYKYCMPLTSAKPRQLGWANITEHNYVIYEYIASSEIHVNDVYKQVGTDKFKKLLSVLEIRKMIPVDDTLYDFFDFSRIADTKYKDLLEKEYNFLKSFKNDILNKAEMLYHKQINTNNIKPCYCNFKLLETAFSQYKTEQIGKTEAAATITASKIEAAAAKKNSSW